jgi:hypothetical protein
MNEFAFQEIQSVQVPQQKGCGHWRYSIVDCLSMKLSRHHPRVCKWLVPFNQIAIPGGVHIDALIV